MAMVDSSMPPYDYYSDDIIDEEYEEDNINSNGTAATDDNHDLLYSILNLPKDADHGHIQRNFKLLSRIYHPDKVVLQQQQQLSNNNNNNSNNQRVMNDVAQQSFVVIKSAVDVLCDPIYRFAYDYGGTLAVTLIKRSQSAHHSNQNQPKASPYDDEDNDNNQDDSTTDDDLYTMLENKLRRDENDEAISLLYEFLENYRITQQQQQQRSNNTNNNLSSLSKFDVSCHVPMVYYHQVNGKYFNSTHKLQKESISLNALGRYPINHNTNTGSKFGINIGAGSDVVTVQPQPSRNNINTGSSSNTKATTPNSNANRNNIKGSIGFDYQPIQGTSIHANIACKHHYHNNGGTITAPDISISTSRKCANDSIMVAAIHGNTKHSKSWNASFISSKPVLYESLFGNSLFVSSNNNSNNKNTKKKRLMMHWRIICDMMGRLRGLMMSLRNIEYPMYTCRLSLSNYPIKLSWCGGETDAFYISLSWGMLYDSYIPRVKIVRISSLGETKTVEQQQQQQQQQWNIKYGLKYDPQAMVLPNGLVSLWSIVCTIQYANECTLRLPIRLLLSPTKSATTTFAVSTPVVWIGSILIAEFVDQQLKHIHWSINDDKSKINNNNNKSRPRKHMKSRGLPPVSFDMLRKVANKKRIDESCQVHGLVILQGILSRNKSKKTYDITDTLQFWVVDGQLSMSLSDERLLWQVDDDDDDNNNNDNVLHQNETLSNTISMDWLWCWNSLFHHTHGRLHERTNKMESVSSLDVRYQYMGITYQISFDDTSMTEIDDNENNRDNASSSITITTTTTTILLPNTNATELGPSNRVR